MNATVRLPNSRRLTTRLGVGLATLMREPSPAVQQRLLHTAYDSGFRHFDVAPSYGLGAAERVVGTFLRTRPEGVTVGTKVGITARGNAGVMRMIQRPARAILRRLPGLRGRATRTVGGIMHTATDFSPASTTRSLENSLRTLGVERLDILLLHEVQPRDLAGGSLLEWLQRQKERGVAESVGLATTAVAASTILRANPGVFDVVQVPSHVLAPASDLIGDIPGLLRITHSVLAVPLALVRDRIQRDARWVRELFERSGVDVTAPGMLAHLLVALGLCENQGGIVLLGTSNAEHLRSAPGALDETDTARLGIVAQFLRESLGQ